jgi:acyl-CoA thioester hydrolase
MSGLRSGSVRFRVRFGETDAAGVAFYGSYVSWFDIGTSNLTRIPGRSSVRPDGKPAFIIPLVEVGASFLKTVRYDQELEIVSTVTVLGRTSFRVEHEIRMLDGTVIATGFEQRVNVRIENDEFVKEPIPDVLRDHLTTGKDGAIA